MPSSLTKKQIEEVQLKLNKDGFSSGPVDGIWGPDTDRAIRDYQTAKHLPGNGELTQQTLADLGVNVNNQTASESNKNETNASANKNETNASSANKNNSASAANNSGSTNNNSGSNKKTTP